MVDIFFEFTYICAPCVSIIRRYTTRREKILYNLITVNIKKGLDSTSMVKEIRMTKENRKIDDPEKLFVFP